MGRFLGSGIALFWVLDELEYVIDVASGSLKNGEQYMDSQA